LIFVEKFVLKKLEELRKSQSQWRKVAERKKRVARGKIVSEFWILVLLFTA